ncbi:uncharacterized protein V6R79_007377 [Siganus canaliculatus]
MDTEKSGEGDASETPQAVETVMEKVAVSKLETPEESTEPENPPAADEETEQTAVNGHDTEDGNLKGTEEAIVTGAVPSDKEKPDVEIEDHSPTEKAEIESAPDVVSPPEPDESPAKTCDPVTAVETEPANTQPKQEPVPEKAPEALPVHTPLAESAAEPEPEKVAETAPEAELQEQTPSEPALVQQLIDVQPPSQDQKAPQQVEPEPESQKQKENDAAAEAAKEEGGEKVAEVAPEKPAQAAPSKEEGTTENVKTEEDNKEAAPEKVPDSETVKGAEAAPVSVESEKNDAEPQKEEDPTPASGTLSFAFLEQAQTKDALKASRTLVVLIGLPGSGKSFLARAIAEEYKDQCSVVCADDHGVKPENPESSADAYKALDDAVVACCGTGTASPLFIVVDDSNHTQDRLARLGEIAEQHSLVAVFLEPRTEWSRDVARLAQKTKRGLQEAQLEAMRSSLEDVTLPLYFGWFLLSSVQDKVRCMSMDFLKTLDTLEAFKKHLVDFSGKAEELDLEQYFQSKGILHCTTKFCDYGKAKGAKEYAEIPAVKELYGSVFELSLTALFVTPRTVGARVSLAEEQLALWPADAEKEVESAASLPLGSRAHVTLGCAEGVAPVQTGFDLLEILALQQQGQQGEPVEEMELGSLVYFGEARWLLTLREPICAPACFSSFYERKEHDPTTKEPEKEKKKKQKCTIL